MKVNELQARVVVHLIQVLRGQPWPTSIAGFCRTTDCHNWTEASDALKAMTDAGLIVVYNWIATSTGTTTKRVSNAEMDAVIFHSEFGIAPTQAAVKLYESLGQGR